MRFTKMHGAGNDYVYVDCFDQPLPDDLPDLARRVSDRHFGIGGDGLILIRPSEVADARMQMLNADGSEAEMCGNGVRCVAKYVYEHGLSRNNPLRIETGAGILSLQLALSDGDVREVCVDMGEPVLAGPEIPTTLPGSKEHDGAVVDAALRAGDREIRCCCVSMGNPHCVTFVDAVDDDWVLGVGPQIEVAPEFPNRVNAEFVEIVSRGEVKQRTWERGSGETLACGTGACAVCVAGVLSGRTDRRLTVHLPGGDLKLHWDASDNHVYMTGEAEEVFSGQWNGKPSMSS